MMSESHHVTMQETANEYNIYYITSSQYLHGNPKTDAMKKKFFKFVSMYSHIMQFSLAVLKFDDY